MRKERNQSAALFMITDKALKIHVEQRVGIEQQKVVRQTAAQLKQRACVSERRLLETGDTPLPSPK